MENQSRSDCIERNAQAETTVLAGEEMGREQETLSLSDLWVSDVQPKNFFFHWLYRLATIVCIALQIMALGALIYENVSVAPFTDMNFSIIVSRLFICFYLAANMTENVPEGILNIFALPSALKLLEIDELDLENMNEILYFAFLIIQGFYLILGFPALIVTVLILVKSFCEGQAPFELTFKQYICFIVFGVYEWVIVIMTLVATIAVVLIQDNAVNCLFNFVGVITVMQLDDVLLKLVHFKVGRPKGLKHNSFATASVKLSLAGAIGVITFIYSFIART